MDLSAFLLARIAEDEEFALRYPPTDPARSRALAECEAKRRIWLRHAFWSGERRECSTCISTWPDGERWPCTTLRALALPYEQHPDYRAEWRFSGPSLRISELR